MRCELQHRCIPRRGTRATSEVALAHMGAIGFPVTNLTLQANRARPLWP